MVALRFGLPLAGLAAMVCVWIPVSILNTRVRPAVTFVQRHPPGTDTRSCMIVYTNPSDLSYASPFSVGWWFQDSGNSTTGIVVQYRPEAGGSEPVMYVSRANFAPVTPSFSAVLIGSQQIAAQLNRAQANEVIAARKIPDALLAAIRSAADHANWAPAPVAPAPSNCILVDPAPYFPLKPDSP